MFHFFRQKLSCLIDKFHKVEFQNCTSMDAIFAYIHGMRFLPNLHNGCRAGFRRSAVYQLSWWTCSGAVVSASIVAERSWTTVATRTSQLQSHLPLKSCRAPGETPRTAQQRQYEHSSRKCHFEHIESLQCYELTRRCSHFPLSVADPGFPRRGAPTPEFVAKTYCLARFLPQTA